MAELLFVPLKKSSDVDIVKPLKNLLQASYNNEEKHEDFSDALNELSRLRTAAIWKVFENPSLDIIYSYYDQLVSLESKVPPHEVQVPFKWKDAFDRGSIFGGRMSLTVSSLAYERVCVTFNVGALQSVVAAQQPLDTEDSLKLAAKLLQQAAGVFAHLKGAVPSALHQEPTPDLQPDTLDALHRLMLAQAQEVVAYKCMRDEMKDAMVAKVCAAAEEMYAEAARAMAKERVKQLWDREWAPHVAAKQALFRGLAQLHQAADCRARAAVGEEIARLQAAVAALAGGAGRAAEAHARASRRLAAALKDNDFIYHERVPPAAELDAVPRAPVARAAPPPPAYTERAPLLAAAVPARVGAALAAAAARRAELAGAEVARLRDATQLLNTALASLGLPGAVEARAGGGELPASVGAAAAAVRAGGGADELRRLMRELPELLRRNTELLDEAERQLREEADADAALRRQFGARWTRTESAALTDTFRRNAEKYRQIVDNAVRADDIVRDKFRLHEKSIELLSGPEGELARALPPDAEGAAELEPAAAERVRELLRALDDLKRARDALEAELKDARVELRERLLAAPPERDERALAEAALHEALQPLRARVDASLLEQERLCELLRAAAAPLQQRAPAASSRAAALVALTAAHQAFQELRANLTEGTKFYNDLTQLLVAYQNKVGDFCFARKTEKEELLKDLTQEASRAGAEPAQPAPSRAAPPAPAASLPYPTQPQGMPLPYGAGYVYAAPPMPALYNPYATLPYPSAAARMPAAPPGGYLPYQHPGGAAPGAYGPPPPGYNPYPQQ